MLSLMASFSFVSLTALVSETKRGKGWESFRNSLSSYDTVVCSQRHKECKPHAALWRSSLENAGLTTKTAIEAARHEQRRYESCCEDEKPVIIRLRQNAGRPPHRCEAAYARTLNILGGVTKPYWMGCRAITVDGAQVDPRERARERSAPYCRSQHSRCLRKLQNAKHGVSFRRRYLHYLNTNGAKINAFRRCCERPQAFGFNCIFQSDPVLDPNRLPRISCITGS